MDADAGTSKCSNFTVNYAEASFVGTLQNDVTVMVSGTVVDGIVNAVKISIASDITGDSVIYGQMSCLNQGNREFMLGGGGCCGSINYTVDYSNASVDVNLAMHKGKLCVEGTIIRQGNTYKLKATKVCRP